MTRDPGISELAALGKIANIDSGFAFRGKIASDASGNVVVLQQRDITELSPVNAGYLPPTVVRVPMEKAFHKHLLTPDVVLLQVRGGQFLAAPFLGTYDAIAAHGVAVIRAGEGALPRYLAWWLNHPRTNARLIASASGATVPYIAIKSLAELELPLPSLKIQHQIVEADLIRAKQRAAQEQLMQFTDQLVDAVTWQAAIEPRSTTS